MEALIAALAIASLSVIGILVFRNTHIRETDASPFLPLSVGAFLGVVFFELLPEAFHETPYASLALTAGFLGFFFLSRALREYHHHHRIGDDCTHEHDHGQHGHHKARASLVLLGDGVHNLADGVVIAVAFSISFELGVATTIGIALHEVPQEIAELFILLRAGYSRTKALLMNFLSALTVVLGVLATNFFIENIEASVGILIGIAAGNLLYIAASDLLPTLADTKVSRLRFVQQSVLVLIGLGLITALIGYAHREGGHEHGANHELHHEEMHDTHNDSVNAETSVESPSSTEGGHVH